MRVLLIEDDFLQADEIQTELRKILPRVQFEVIQTEHEFRSRLNSIALSPPDVAIVDVMLLWAFAEKDMPIAPDDWNGHARAGLRCARLLRARTETAKLPIIFYTLLERDEDLGVELEEFTGAHFVQKEHVIDGLVEAVRVTMRE